MNLIYENEIEILLESLEEGIIVFNNEMHIDLVNSSAQKMIKAHGSLIDNCLQLAHNSIYQKKTLTNSLSYGEHYFDLICIPTDLRVIVIVQNKSSHRNILEMGKNFIANASHELRTPITIIRGFAETLHDLPHLPEEMLKDITEKIVRNCERMDNLVKNLLTLADIENLPYVPSYFIDIIPILEECRYQILSAHPEAAITLHLPCTHMQLPADPHLFELAITNVLRNAVKYSPNPACIELTLEKTQTLCRISIADRGMGIPPEDIGHIFERFYTVNKTRSRRLGGAGLGLSIVKTALEKHKGSIHVQSSLGEGSTFILSFPLKKQETLET